MTRELFEKAKFGDRFVTRGGQEALFLRLTENSEWQFADFYVKDWGQIRVNRENGKCLNGPDIENDIVGMMPTLPSGLDEAAIEIASDIAPTHPDIGFDECFEKIKDGIKAGVQWRDAQIPKLPDSIDEAAEEYVKTTSVKVWGRIDPKKDLKGYMARANYGTGLLDGFKAGAEWMAGQWETIDGEITTTSDNGWEIIRIPKKLYPLGTKVTVQIRKK